VLRWSGLPVVHLRPTVFFDGMFLVQGAKGIRDDNVIRLPFADGKTSPIAAADVGAAAAAVLAQAGYEGDPRLRGAARRILIRIADYLRSPLAQKPFIRQGNQHMLAAEAVPPSVPPVKVWITRYRQPPGRGTSRKMTPSPYAPPVGVIPYNAPSASRLRLTPRPGQAASTNVGSAYSS
jgi:hypothetical protein